MALIEVNWSALSAQLYRERHYVHQSSGERSSCSVPGYDLQSIQMAYQPGGHPGDRDYESQPNGKRRICCLLFR